MIKQYNIEYGMTGGELVLEVDTEKFTIEKAKETLDFFTWNYNKKADPIDEAIKKYALLLFEKSMECGDFIPRVIRATNETEGFYPVDGSHGITIKELTRIELDESELEITISNKEQ